MWRYHGYLRKSAYEEEGEEEEPTVLLDSAAARLVINYFSNGPKLTFGTFGSQSHSETF